VTTLVPEAAHVILRDARLNGPAPGLTEVPLGEGDCPVEQVVAELISRNFFRPFYGHTTGRATSRRGSNKASTTSATCPTGCWLR
jgi:hypothetical protein